MQWLIDIFKELIDTTDIYIDRGDPAAADFVIGDFTRDGAWHTLDLSAIVPPDVTAVSVRTIIRGAWVNKQFRMRTPGNANAANIFVNITQVANLGVAQLGTIYPDANQQIEYWFTDATVNVIFMVINGWWLKKN